MYAPVCIEFVLPIVLKMIQAPETNTLLKGENLKCQIVFSLIVISTESMQEQVLMFLVYNSLFLQ